MNTKQVLIATATVFFLVGCTGKGKKQTLEDTSENNVKLEELYSAELTLDTIIPNPGIKYPEKRGVDPQNPPIVINIENKAENGELDLSQFYTQVEYVKIEHPLAEKGIAFLGNSTYQVMYERGASSGRGANSRVYLTEDKLIAGDNFFGYHCFDMQGNYMYTLAAKKELPEFDVKSNSATMYMTSESEIISGISVSDDNCLITKVANRKGNFVFHNLGKQKNYLNRPASYGTSILLSPDSYVSHVYNPAYTGKEPMLYVFDIKGDTLSAFMNYNPLADIGKGNFTNPESSDFYRYNQVLSMRQAYNDTIFRVSADKLTPAFVLNSGNKKPDMQTALKGDKKGKIFIYQLMETNDFLFIVHTEDYDCPNNRKSDAVKFFYSYYDKKSGKRYSIPSSEYPEVFTLQNSIEGTIRLMLSNASVYKDKLYSSYTKTQLKQIMDSEAFASFPPSQQEKLKALHDEMTEYELLIMILK